MLVLQVANTALYTTILRSLQRISHKQSRRLSSEKKLLQTLKNARPAELAAADNMSFVAEDGGTMQVCCASGAPDRDIVHRDVAVHARPHCQQGARRRRRACAASTKQSSQNIQVQHKRHMIPHQSAFPARAAVKHGLGCRYDPAAWMPIPCKAIRSHEWFKFERGWQTQ
jgi:hypothetical protein